MSEIVDRVTEQLWLRYLQEGGPWHSLVGKDEVELVVRSVVAEMREPTEGPGDLDPPLSERGFGT